ncbi:hypothetical protein [Streptomyces nigrescens]|uniref:hypothetical protein n=1 Tax=Streptomyces nigrescens TaxID=1920 RepID=UPI0021C3F1CD|nr:hypothetical protein [Streptomyces nigrescens]
MDVAEGPFRVVRPDDMLVVDIALVNLHFVSHHLERRDRNEPAFVLVGLPPQHVLEEVPGQLPASALGPMKAFTAGSTRLAFSLPADTPSLELSLDALLDWASLVPMMVPVGPQSPDPPGSTIFQGIPGSVIEFPTRLLLTYNEPVDWIGRTQPQQADGRTALWHARLQSHSRRDGDVQLRAFATTGGQGVLPGNSPIRPENLADLVTLTSQIMLVPPGDVPIKVPSAPLHAEQFIVTPQGSSVHLHGAWGSPPDTEVEKERYKKVGRHLPSLVAYDHITGLGRDQYIRVVDHGCLCTGHEALDVTETRRVFIARPDDGIVAYLQQDEYIVVKQPEVQYGAETGFPHAGREMPFRSLRITDRVTPLIAPHDENPDVFWIRLRDSLKDFEFTLIGTDSEGRKVSFTMPLVFVKDGTLDEQKRLAEAYDTHKEPTLGDRLQRSMNGQVMAMAQPPVDAPGSTSHAVGTLTFGLGSFALGPQGGSGTPVVGQPCVREAAVRVPAVEQFTPKGGDLQVVFNPTYLQQTMEGHPAGAYLDLQTALNLTFGAEQAGGLSSPNSAVKTITSRAGVVPDVFATDGTGAVVGAKDIDTIKKAFGGAQILGIDLSTYLKGLVKDNFDTLRQLGDEEIAAILKDAKGQLPAPVLRIRDLIDGQGKELRYVWKPPLDPPRVPPDNKPDPDALLDVSKASLVLDARTVRSKDAVDQATVDGKLTNFAMNFFGMARVEFAELKFSTGPGKKPEVSASGVELKFSNELEFINTLRTALPADVFGPGAFLDVQPSGIRAGYTLAVPAIPLGGFMLSNLALAAAVEIPFDRRPVSFRFSVSEQKHPFNVTVSLFGGGGYFSMLVDTGGVREVEGALEFGGSAALDLGVASGGVSVMAGIHFLFADGDVTLGGYLRCNGFLTVLGIVTVSVEFYLELSYEKHDGQSVVRGRGTLTVSVRIAFFSKSVKLELERSFSGAPGDPTFAQCISKEHDWREYCAAFAA